MKISETTFNKMPEHLQRLFVKLPNPGSDEVVALFPTSSTTGARSKSSKAAEVAGTKWLMDNHESTEYTDAGSAARFFYCAKVSPSERGDSKHPTMKPVALMRYLCRLVTPKGGTVLDPFGGSGSTAMGALHEGFNAILCELNPDYVALIHERCDPILNPMSQPMPPDLFEFFNQPA